jgi:hypothetical protein
MAQRSPKKPWNAGIDLLPELNGGPAHVQPPLPPAQPVRGLTTGHMMPAPSAGEVTFRQPSEEEAAELDLALPKHLRDH